jgi:hypothetical protein
VGEHSAKGLRLILIEQDQNLSGHRWGQQLHFGHTLRAVRDGGPGLPGYLGWCRARRRMAVAPCVFRSPLIPMPGKRPGNGRAAEFAFSTDVGATDLQPGTCGTARSGNRARVACSGMATSRHGAGDRQKQHDTRAQQTDGRQFCARRMPAALTSGTPRRYGSSHLRSHINPCLVRQCGRHRAVPRACLEVHPGWAGICRGSAA